MNCGTILFDSKFQFPDGTIDYKLIIIVCDYGTNYLVLQTTRQPDGKNNVAGCQLNDKPSNYFIPGKTLWFEDNTWILLDEIFEYNSDEFFYKEADGIVFHKSVLSNNFMKQLIECALKSRDIDGFDKEYIQKAYDNL